MTTRELYNLFAPFGNVISARVMVERDTGRSRGFGFVSFDNYQAAELAIRTLDGHTINNKRLKVSLKKPGQKEFGGNMMGDGGDGSGSIGGGDNGMGGGGDMGGSSSNNSQGGGVPPTGPAPTGAPGGASGGPGSTGGPSSSGDSSAVPAGNGQ